MASMHELAAAVGEERFRRACEWAWRYAAGIFPPTQRVLESVDDWPKAVTGVPHELSDLVWESEGSWLARVELAFQLYREMPCYATVMYTHAYFIDWDDGVKRRFWDEYRSLLSDDDDRLADPVAYSLYVDYFEDPITVEESWEALASPGALSDRGLQRLLEVSGPVPYVLKGPLYARLLERREMHTFIFRGIRSSAFDVCGHLDAKRAQGVLRRLSLPPSTEGFEELAREIDHRASLLGRVARAVRGR